jgi:ribosomal protein L44E
MHAWPSSCRWFRRSRHPFHRFASSNAAVSCTRECTTNVHKRLTSELQTGKRKERRQEEEYDEQQQQQQQQQQARTRHLLNLLIQHVIKLLHQLPRVGPPRHFLAALEQFTANVRDSQPDALELFVCHNTQRTAAVTPRQGEDVQRRGHDAQEMVPL